MADTPPLIPNWADGVACTTLTGLKVMVEGEDSISPEIAPGRLPVAGTDIQVIVSDENFVINSTHTGGDITQVNITAGTGLTGDVNTTTGAHTQTINVVGGNGITAASDEISVDIKEGIGLIFDGIELSLDDVSGTASGVEVSGASAVDVCATSESLHNSVLTLNTVASKCAWKEPALIDDTGGTGIKTAQRFVGGAAITWEDTGGGQHNMTLGGGNSNFISSGVQCKQLTMNTLTANNVTVSAYALKVGTNSTGCPFPNPFCYVQTTGAGTNTTDEINFAIGAATTVITSDTDDLSWDDTNKYFNVSAPGTYEILGNFVVDSGSQSDPIEITSKKNGSDVHIISPKLYGNVGPEERTFHSVLTAVAGDYITVTIHMDDGGSKTAHLEIGSNLMLRRIL